MRRGLVATRAQAQEAVAAGRVLVSGAPATKSARLVAPAEPVRLLGDAPRFVSRGGEKLEAALDRFGVAVPGSTALDAGASTGGFTDCLLQRGAAGVCAVDVGFGQLDARLRADPRVVVRERCNIRTVDPAELAPPGAPFTPFDLVVADLSFISLRAVLPVLCSVLPRPGADLVLLVKPQFEAGRAQVSRGAGVIRDPGVWAAALRDVAFAMEEQGTGIMCAMASPLRGAAGNREFFLHGRAATPGLAPGDRDAALAAALPEPDGAGDGA